MTTTAPVKKWHTALVWVLRIFIGATFIISGVAKMIDPYGFIYKITDYLNVWQMSMPEGIITLGAVGISIVEFMVGFMLATGSYRRSSPLIGTLIMAFMLPLSLYLVIANPVEHCGCFGDFLVISNSATFIKNIVITTGLVWLIPNNNKVSGPFLWFVQWVQAALAFAYIGLIGIIGYHEQPLIDFRPYKIGTHLVADSDSDDEPDMQFVYEKDGHEATFGVDNLPDDSWTFVRRIEPEQTVTSTNT
ncbi:MAG: DoxX family protein [Muribaculaceae bacterium]|nr:DoxX family protein [Muribaculaceae bacterium]